MNRPEVLGAGPRALPATQVLIGRNAWLVRLRWPAAAAIVIATQLAARVLPQPLQSRRLYLVALCLAAYNCVAWLVLRYRLRQEARTSEGEAAGGAERRPSRLGAWLLPASPRGTLQYDRRAEAAAVFALGQITLDLMLLALTLHFAGGLENPVWVFFTFHVVFASVLLSPQATYAVATLGALLLAGVLLGELGGLLPHYPLGIWASDSYRHPDLIAGYLCVQAGTLFTTAYLASSITARLRRRELDVLLLTRSLADKAERLEAAYQELSVAEKAKSQYMRKVAHELRQPLGTVKTALSVALQQGRQNLDPQTRSLIERAERRAGALAELTQELLSLARARGGHAAVSLAPVDIAAVAARVLDELQSRAADAGVPLTVELPTALPTVLGDAEGLTDLIGNLVGNAIRYTPPGGRVWFRARPAEDRLVLEVEDTGIGIPAEDRERIFEEFYRSPAAREHSQQGSGLGLAIVKAVVDQHRGSITVTSREGGGTRFHVELPLAIQPDLVPIR